MSSGGVFIPTTKETLQFENLTLNSDETQNYKETFTREKEQLNQTYDECQETLERVFDELKKFIDERKELLLKQLEMRFTERDDSLEKQINLLEEHEQLNKDTENKCKELIAIMQDRKQRKERTEMIIAECNECINKSPNLKEVPIDLKHTFLKQKQTIDIIGDLGKLVFKGIERGKPRKFTFKETEINTTKYHVGDNNKNNNNNKSSNTIKNHNNRNINNSNNFDEKENNYYNNYNGNGNNRNNNNNNNNNSNGFNHGEEVEEEEINGNKQSMIEENVTANGNDIDENIVLLSKVKLSITVNIGNEIAKPKMVMLLNNNKKNEYSLNCIKTKLKYVKLVKELKRDDIRYKFILTETNQEINDDNDLIQYVISQAKDEKTPINMKAQIINV